MTVTISRGKDCPPLPPQTIYEIPKVNIIPSTIIWQIPKRSIQSFFFELQKEKKNRILMRSRDAWRCTRVYSKRLKTHALFFLYGSYQVFFFSGSHRHMVCVHQAAVLDSLTPLHVALRCSARVELHSSKMR